jgi:nucleoid DNA-binding protein
MSDEISRLSPTVRSHIQAITRSSGLEQTEESFQRMAAAWLEKKELFQQQCRALAMKEVPRFASAEPGGALALTYSGSLVSVEPLVQGNRRVEYASIPLRVDVPALAVADRTGLARDLQVDGEAEFTAGPVKSTSDLLLIAVCDPQLPLREQSRRIREAMIFLTNGFVRINRTIAPPQGDAPEQFTLRSIVAYLASRSGLPKTRVHALLRDYHSVLEAGILLGERVPLGAIGRLSLVRRPARKARAGVNPATGEPLTIPARPESMGPRMRFSGALKARLRDLPVQMSRDRRLPPPQ